MIRSKPETFFVQERVHGKIADLLLEFRGRGHVQCKDGGALVKVPRTLPLRLLYREK